MAKVCEKLFPIGSYKGQRSAGFYMHDTLKTNLDVLLKNVTKDWDFVIIISGSGRVRIGKSLLGIQIACYWTYQLEKLYGIKVPFNIKENIVFHGTQLIKQGNKLGTNHKHSVLIFDEAGADLEGVKAMKRTTQNVKDYLRECGQYNMLTILILPEYFDLPKGVALSRSDILLNCFTSVNDNDMIERGFFNFYSRPNKKHLYLRGKKELNYKAYPDDFAGDWDNVYPVDEEEYREAKRKALKSREVMSAKEERRLTYLRGAFKILISMGLTQREIAEKIKGITKMITSHRYIGRLIDEGKEEDDDLD